MRHFLTPEERSELLKQHRIAREKNVADRIKVILLYDEGWTFQRIADVLFLDQHTVSRYYKDYEDRGKLNKGSGGSECRLSEEKIEALKIHLDEILYQSSYGILSYIKEKFGICYKHSGLLSLLKKIGYNFKKSKGIPAKAEPEKQNIFIKHYERLKRETPEDEPILFGDGVHPTMATKLSYGWIRQGLDHLIPTSGTRTRMNIFGAINLETMQVHYQDFDTIDSAAICKFLEKLRSEYQKAKNIHLILDQGSYNKSKETFKEATKLGITIHLLPPYSPNLNPIERLWKVMNETSRNNVYFKTATHFRDAIHAFFQDFWPKNCKRFIDRINDNFEALE